MHACLEEWWWDRDAILFDDKKTALQKSSMSPRRAADVLYVIILHIGIGIGDHRWLGMIARKQTTLY